MKYSDKELADWADIASARVLFGDCMEKMKEIPDCSIDAVVCDPPYGLSPDSVARTWADIEEGRKIGGFMGKGWDAAVPCHNFFAECYRVLKHGGHLIAFSSTRTVFALGMACQRGGFELRDQIFWCYFSGFPKSHDISKAIDKEAGVVREVVGRHPNPASEIYQGGSLDRDIPITKPATKESERWSGFGTALKPAVEPALLARKPLEKGLTIAQNVLKHGTGALNIDGCRFGYGDPCWVGPNDEMKTQAFKQPKNPKGANGTGKQYQNEYRKIIVEKNDLGRWPANIYQCPKVSRSEREEGCEELPSKTGAETVQRKEGSAGMNNPRAGAGRTASEVKNIHPTVKPIKLMRWLARLVMPPGEDAVLLDTFAGSGSTLVAAEKEGFNSIGIEMNPEYVDIIRARLSHACKGE